MKMYGSITSRIVIALMISVIFVTTAVVGDIAPPDSRGETMQPVNVTGVTMVNETVQIDMDTENASVRCDFTLMNPGENETLLVGFPLGLGDDWTAAGLHDEQYAYPLEDFKAYVNSRQVATREMDVNGSKWMVWNMSFDEMEIADVRVSYWVPLSSYGNYGRMRSHWFTYVLETGAAWGGVIDEANITINLCDIEPDWITEISPDGYTLEDYSIRWNLTSIEPTENIHIRFETLQDEKYTITGFVSDETHAGVPGATVELRYWHSENGTAGRILDGAYGEPLVTTTSDGTNGAVGWYNLRDLNDRGDDWIDVVIVAHTFDSAGNKRTGISDPVQFWPPIGWCGDVVDVTIGALTSTADMMMLQVVADSNDGKAYTITYTVKNNGDENAAASTTAILINGVEVATDSVPELASGESHSNTLGPFTLQGYCDTIAVCADSKDKVSESNEGNNCKGTTFCRPGPLTSAEVPALTPFGAAMLIGSLSIFAVLNMRRRDE